MLKYKETRVLIVGAGAIGQVYGSYLQKGGDIVNVLVRPHHLEQATEGYILHQLGIAGKRAHYDLFKPNRVLTSLDQVPGEIYTAVWFCVPTPVLKEPWIPQLLEMVRGATIVVTGMSDKELLQTMVPEETIVTFLVSMVAYPGPLEGEDFWPPGMVYYFPPFSPSAFEGSNADRAMACVRELSNGGAPAAWRDDVPYKTDVASALLMPFVMGAELSGWSVQGLRKGQYLEPFLNTYRELVALAQQKHGKTKDPLPLRVLNHGQGRKIFDLLLRFAPRLVPFPLDAYLQFHFTKIRQQTHETMQSLIAEGPQFGMQMQNLRQLYGAWAGLVGAPQGGFLPPAQSGQFPQAPQSGQIPAAQSGQFPAGLRNPARFRPHSPASFRRPRNPVSFHNPAPSDHVPQASQSGQFAQAAQSGQFPQAPASGQIAQAPPSGQIPQAPQSGQFPQASQSGQFPQAPQSGAFMQSPQSGSIVAAEHYPTADSEEATPPPGEPQVFGLDIMGDDAPPLGETAESTPENPPGDAQVFGLDIMGDDLAASAVGLEEITGDMDPAVLEEDPTEQ